MSPVIVEISIALGQVILTEEGSEKIEEMAAQIRANFQQLFGLAR